MLFDKAAKRVIGATDVERRELVSKSIGKLVERVLTQAAGEAMDNREVVVVNVDDLALDRASKLRRQSMQSQLPSGR